MNNPYHASPVHLASAAGDQAEVLRLLRAAGSFADLRAGDDIGMTPLHYACFTGQSRVIECILFLDARLATRRANNGLLPLHVAANNGHTSAVKSLLSNGNFNTEARSNLGWTALHFAAYVNDIHTISLLGELGAHVDAATADGSTALHVAAARGHVEAMSSLCCYQPTIDMGDINLKTPLMSATIKGALGAVELLMEAGCKLDCTDRDGWTALHWASSQGHLHIAAHLIHSQRDLDKLSIVGHTPLHLAVASGKHDMVKLLIDRGADVNKMADIEGAQRPIHIAANIGDIEAMDILFKSGASHNAKCKMGWTPLFYCLSAGHTKSMEWLYRDQKESLIPIDMKGSNLFHAAAVCRKNPVEVFECLLRLYRTRTVPERLLASQNSDGYSPFFLASLTGNTDLTAKMLNSNKQAINLSGFSELSPIHSACYNRNIKMVQLLLAAGADVNSPGPDKVTPLHQSSMMAYTDIMKVLLGSKANIECRTATQGLTPLLFAAKSGQVESLKLLVQYGANLKAVTSDGNSCLHLAAWKGSWASTVFLLGKGLDPKLRNTNGHDVVSMAISGGDIHIVETVRDAARTQQINESLAVTVDLFADVNISHNEDEKGSDPMPKMTQRSQSLEMQKGSFGHLPKIKSCAFPFLEVPYLATHTYDGPSLEGYLERQGWDLHDNLALDIPFSSSAKYLLRLRDDRTATTPSRDVLDMLQGWLFFGVIIEYFKGCGLEVDAREFIITAENGKGNIISTTPLSRYLKTLAGIEQDSPVDVQRKHIRHVNQSLTTAWYFFHNLGLGWTPPRPYSSVAPVLDEKQQIILSIALVCETLENAVSQIWPATLRLEYEPNVTSNEVAQQRKTLMAPGGRLKELRPPLTVFAIKDRYVFDYLVSRGWCLNLISMLLNSNLGVTALFLISMLERPEVPSHRSCSEFRCFAFDIKESTYETKHVETCAGCRHIFVDSNEVTKILKNGGIPAVRIHDNDAGGNILLDVLETKYIAISHVWADGIGNPRTNSLPQCQLAKLKSLTDNIAMEEGQSTGASAIWIDTLCVPLEPEARRLALGLLSKTYRQAQKVLVLDADLEKSSCQVSSEEVFAKILCSAWLRRLWTLQEAMVAEHRLLIQFQDGFVDLTTKKNEAMKKIVLQPESNHRGLGDLIDVLFSKIASKADERHISRIAELGDAVTYRSTSKLSDEHICLASLLGLDVKELALIPRTDIEKRVICFYVLLSKKVGIPTTILFAAGPRLETDGYRWAITSFLANATLAASSVLNLSPPLTMTECKLHSSGYGLCVTMGGWFIKDLDILLDRNFVFRDPKSQTAFLCSNQEREDGMWSGDRDGIHEYSQTAILFSPWFVSAAALVAVLENSDNVIFARYLWRINIMETTLFDNLVATRDALERTLASRDRQDLDVLSIEGYSQELPEVLKLVDDIPEDQKWRIV